MNVEFTYMNLHTICHSLFILLIILFMNVTSDFDYIGAQSTFNITSQNDTDLMVNRLPSEAVLITEKIAQNGTVMIDLPLKNHQPPGANWTYVLDSLPLYGSVLPFKENGDQILNGIIPYEAATNFSGVDYFGYMIIDNTSSTRPGLVSITTYADNPVIDNPILRIIVAILVVCRFHNNNSSSCFTHYHKIA